MVAVFRFCAPGGAASVFSAPGGASLPHTAGPGFRAPAVRHSAAFIRDGQPYVARRRRWRSPRRLVFGFVLRCALGRGLPGPVGSRPGGSRLGGLPHFCGGRRRGPAYTRRPFVLRCPLAGRAAFGLGLALPAVRPDDHDHVTAVLLGRGLDEAEFLDVAGEALQQPEPEFGPGLLASPEHDRHLDLVSLPEEPLDVAPLRPVVMRVDLGPELDLLDDRLGLVLAGLPGFERGLVFELAVVHKLADRWPCRGRDLDQVEVGLLGQPERITQGNNPYLLAVRADEPYLGNPDALVDTGFDADVTSCELSPNPASPGGHAATIPAGPGSGLAARIRERPRTACMRSHQPAPPGEPMSPASRRQAIGETCRPHASCARQPISPGLPAG